MASYRPFPPPPQSTFGAPPANQNPLPPPPPQSRGVNQYSQNWGGYGGGDGSSFPQSYPTQTTFQHANFRSFSLQSHYGAPPSNQVPLAVPPQQQQQYSYPPPPPPESSHPPPPPPSSSRNSVNLPSQPPMYYPSSQYSQFNNQPLQPLQPPSPPPSSPLGSAIPPPPPSVPAASHNKEGKLAVDRRAKKDSRWREPGNFNPGVPSKQHIPIVPPVPGRRSNGPTGRVETEEERRLRKKRESEKQRQEDNHRQQLKESQSKVLQKTQMISFRGKGDRRATPLLSAKRTENQLKKPTTFVCKLKIAKYRITSLEKLHKPIC